MSLKPSILTVGKFSYYAVSEHGIIFNPETPRGEWLEAVQKLTNFYENAGMARERTLMLLADALTFGEQAYGEDYAQAVQDARSALGLTVKTIRNAVYTYKRLPVALRGANLSLSHFKEIAPLETEDQEKFIARAVRENLTVSELKTEIAEAFPKTKRGNPRKAAQSTESDNSDSITQKLTDSAAWLIENSPTEKMKKPLAELHKAFRRKWQDGRKRK